MIFKSLLAAAAVLVSSTLLATTANAELVQVRPNRDTTVYWVGPCNQCVSDACRSCNYGKEGQLLIAQQLRVSSSILLNFDIPTDNLGCYLSVPPPLKNGLLGTGTNFTINSASADWSETQVTGENAPAKGALVAVHTFNDSDYQIVDVSDACKNGSGASHNVSLYLSIQTPANAYARYNSNENNSEISLFVEKR
ncbi:hypothetical protein H4219_001620 [Mycoemilia scoparia]|uniref:Carbohydrate-binding module family 96 domain-containing protein n=1 Tax=Mycoemilia scoparia TaxID=417184 RepID=A0A9W8A0H1_9FUNG|nr:hypothetical protein H4219_001620 [Mycoemilia scoparia]